MMPRIHVFAAPADQFFVNSFIVEGEDALVVDVQFRDLIAANARDGRLDEAGLETVHTAMVEGRNGWPLDGLIGMNAEAMATEIADAGKGHMT
jgi:hypothetical protein